MITNNGLRDILEKVYHNHLTTDMAMKLIEKMREKDYNEGEANMKQRVQNLLDDNDDYMDVERLFHYL